MSIGYLAEQPALAAKSDSSLEQAQERLERVFGRQFTILNGRSGETLVTARDDLDLEVWVPVEVCRAVARQGRAEFVAEEDPLITLAIPLEQPGGDPLVAVRTFLTRASGRPETVERAAGELGIWPEAAVAWAAEQVPMPPEALATG